MGDVQNVRAPQRAEERDRFDEAWLPEYADDDGFDSAVLEEAIRRGRKADYKFAADLELSWAS